jgi:hypothetical protein
VSRTKLREELIELLRTSGGKERKVRAPLIGSYTHRSERRSEFGR